MKKLILIAAVLLAFVTYNELKSEIVIEVSKNKDGTFNAICGSQKFNDITEEELACFFGTVVEPYANQ